MKEKPRISVGEVGGINIGEKRDRYDPVVREFGEQRGISISRGAIRNWRRGIRQAGATKRRIVVPEIVSEEGAARKNAQFLRIIKTALEEKEMRTHGLSVFPSKRYGLIDSVAETLHVPPGEINVSFRLMRADISLAKEVPESVKDNFADAVDRFRSKYPLNSYRESLFTRKLHDMGWDGKDMRRFYEVLSKMGPSTVKAWVSYELEMLKAWYMHQQGVNTLTVFDEIVFENWRKYNLRSILKEIKDLTGVSFDQKALASHVRMIEGTFLPKID